MPEGCVNIVIVEDDPVIRDWLASIIGSSKGFACRGQYGDLESALAGLSHQPPDIVLMDIVLPGKSGIEGTRKLKQLYPNIDILILTVQENDDMVFQALCAGASGYLTKNITPRRLIEAINEVRNGGAPMSTNIARMVVASFRRSAESPLTPRETEGNAGLTYVDQWDIGFDQGSPDTVYMFNDGGVQKSTNGGMWWNKVNNGLVTGQIYKIASAPSDTNILIGGFQDHGLQRVNTVNGNTRWFKWSSNDGTSVIIHPTDTNILYGDFFFAHHRKSTNGGLTWRTSTFQINNGMTETGQPISPLLMHPFDPNVLYCAGLTKIFMTVNGGAQWTAIADLQNVYTMTIDQQDPNVLYAHSYTNTSWVVWKSTDGGFGWTPITNSSIPSWRVVDLEVDPSHSGTLYAVRNSASLNQDHVKKSTDFGETWTNITSNLPDVTMSAIAISPYSSNQLYVATDLGVFASTNGGGDWFEFNDGLPLVYCTDIHYHPRDHTLRLATLGRGAWKTKAIDVPPTSVGESATVEHVDAFRLFQNYPNPFNPSTTIRYELDRQSHVAITIHNQLGQEIQRVLDKIQEAGMHTVLWNGLNRNGLPVSSGVYYIRARSNGMSRTFKAILAR